MNDRPIEPGDVDGEPDPAIVDALRTLAPPPHRFGFWAEVEDDIGRQVAPTMVVPVVPDTAPPPPPPPGPVPPLAEVTPLPPPRGGGFPRWLAVAAAALVVVAALGAALLARTTGTDVATTASSSTLAATTAVSTTLPAPTTTAPVVTAPVTTPKPTVASTTTPTTTRSPLTASHEALGPLRIGMTAKQTTATGAMAAPTDPLDTGGQCTYAEPAGGTYTADDFDAIFLDGRLARLYFGRESRVRTPEGIGSGSASSKLRAIAGTRTESPHPYGGGTNVDIIQGDVGYQFTVDGGKVTEWSIGTKVGLGLPEGCA